MGLFISCLTEMVSILESPVLTLLIVALSWFAFT